MPKAVRAQDSAALAIFDDSLDPPKCLFGKRNRALQFMPGKFVFPGGRYERADLLISPAGALPQSQIERLCARARNVTPRKAEAFALTALREIFEETGILIGQPCETPPSLSDKSPWLAFFGQSIVPDLRAIRFFARAITPPHLPRRYDTRFFTVSASAIAAHLPGFVGPDKELTELVWADWQEMEALDLAPISRVIVAELRRHYETGFSAATPVALLSYARGISIRHEL